MTIVAQWVRRAARALCGALDSLDREFAHIGAAAPVSSCVILCHPVSSWVILCRVI
jgi:hypothetical protein